MRVLIITGSYPPMKCGVGDYTCHLAEALAEEEGISPAVLTDVSAGSSNAVDGVTLFPIVNGWTLSCAASIQRTVRGWKPDLVHIQYPTQGYKGRFLSYQLPMMIKATGLPIVQTWHEYKPHGSITVFVNALLTRGFIVVRPDFEKNSSSYYQWIFRHRPFRFIPNAPTIPVVLLTEEQRSSIRREMFPDADHVVGYFGFVSPAKNITALFEIADPAKHHIVLACDLDPSDPYHAEIIKRTRSETWKKKVTVTGFLPPLEVAKILATADAMVFPFREGTGAWNTSIQGAVAQGTFVMTTSRERNGFDEKRNIFYAAPGDLTGMREALACHMGRRALPQDISGDWSSIAREHVRFYRELLGSTPPTPSTRAA